MLAYPLRIAPGTNLAVPIRFQPTSLGAQLGTIIVSSDDPSGSHSDSGNGDGTFRFVGCLRVRMLWRSQGSVLR